MTTAATDAALAERLVAASAEVPLALAADLDDEGRLPPNSFAIVDAVPTVLRDAKPPLFEAADAFLRAVVSLDERWFLALQRLADCDAEWLRAELQKEPVDWDKATTLHSMATGAYKQALLVAERVLDPSATRPSYYAAYDLRKQEKITFTSRAVLDDWLGQRSGDVPTLERAALLALRAVSRADPDELEQELNILALILIHLGELELAAKTVSASLALSLSERARGIVSVQTNTLRTLGQPIPDGGLPRFAEVAAELCTGPLLRDWQDIGIWETRGEHVEGLSEVLQGVLEIVPGSDVAKDALAELTTAG